MEAFVEPARHLLRGVTASDLRLGGSGIRAADAPAHIWGYAIGLDMTRRDLQNDMKKQGRPWCIGKAFE